MDKLTLFDFLSFLIPGALLNGSLLLLLYQNGVVLQIKDFDGQVLINSVAFLAVSYIIGMIISEFAFRLYGNKKHILADCIIKMYEKDFLEKLNKQSESKIELKFMNAVGETDKDKLERCFAFWMEYISVSSTYSLTTVLHGQYMMFRNLRLTTILIAIGSIAIYLIQYKYEMFMEPGFYVTLSFCFFFFIFFRVLHYRRFIRYVDIAIKAIYSLFFKPQKIL